MSNKLKVRRDGWMDILYWFPNKRLSLANKGAVEINSVPTSVSLCEYHMYTCTQ